MAVLTDNVGILSKGRIDYSDIPCGVDIFFAGGLTMVDSAGYGMPAASASANNECAGVNQEKVDNSGGSAGDLEVTVGMGRFRLLGTGAIAQANLHEILYAVNDGTVQTSSGSNLPKAGYLARFEASEDVWVDVHPRFNIAHG